MERGPFPISFTALLSPSAFLAGPGESGVRACEKIKTVSRKVAKAPRIPKNSWLSFLLLGVFATLREIFSQTLRNQESGISKSGLLTADP